jgi:hypothetical protein
LRFEIFFVEEVLEELLGSGSSTSTSSKILILFSRSSLDSLVVVLGRFKTGDFERDRTGDVGLFDLNVGNEVLGGLRFPKVVLVGDLSVLVEL